LITEINIDDFDIVKDNEMKFALIDFFNNISLPNSAIECKHLYISCFENIKLIDLTRLTFCNISDYIQSKKHLISRFSRVNVVFLGFLLKNNLYKGNDIDDLTPFTELLFNTTTNANYNNKTFFNKEKTVSEFFVHSYPTPDGYELYRLVDTNCKNTFIVDLLNDFYKSDSFGRRARNIEFAMYFINSDSNIENFHTILNFEYLIFENQFKYYKDNANQLKELIKFYLYLYELSGYKNIFKSNDPIDTTMMQRPDFLQLFEDGYRLVNYNPFETPPSHHRWLLKPNGFESGSTKLKHNSYQKINFSEVENESYISLLKQYFWESTVNLESRKDFLSITIKFLNFIVAYKSNSISTINDSIDLTLITAIEIYSYRGYIETQSISTSTKNQYYFAVKGFLYYCIDKKYLTVQSGAFEYLDSNFKPSGNGGVDIPEDELIKLEEQLRSLSNDNLTQNLYYIIFHLAIETELRISQLLSLKISEIKEGMKENQFFIHSTTKTSNSDKVYQAISAYAKRHLDIAIKNTEKLRDEATEDFKDYIFLAKKNANSKDITPIRPATFNDYLKKQCKNICIKEYTASNLRDTHMTRAVEYGFKQKLNPLEMRILTNHVKTATTNNHYVNHKIRTFAEATFGVVIGDIDLKGTIITDNNEIFDKEDTVDNGCGFCRENACKIMNELGCPMCDGFVVTLDRIPFYELRIKELDHAINNETIAHEREHLHTIKRLYVAYLERLYTLREELSN
jgi:integrase